ISLFAHILNASNIWLNRIEGKPDPYGPWREIPKEDLENETNLLKTRLENLLLTYSESFGNEIRIYKNTKGDEFKNSIENILLHVTHHGAYHRGQIVQLLKEKHKNAPATDYIVWMRENGVI
ncbi:MAG: hypothetical protein K8R21_15575, partial [Leptospira sp.]|nr:hypothetical protein [Leptospira sp.]